MSADFYVYEHWRPDKGECFYVGKGRSYRAAVMHGRNSHHRAIQAKLAGRGLRVDVRFVAVRLTEQDALDLEVRRIAYWRGENKKLANRTDGGDGVTGLKLSADQREKISLRMGGRATRLGAILSAETRRKISIAHLGKAGPQLGIPLREETKRKIAATLRGRGAGEKNPFFGRTHSPETRKRISDAKRGKPGRPHTEESRQKIIDGHARRRAALAQG